ncbi:MAG: response regulator [Desulfonatronovibrionaceae bacterium]
MNEESRNNIRVLLVDDEVDFMETLVKRMKKRGLNVKGVKSGEEALAVLGEETFQVVVLDVKMPGMNGIEVLKIIKKRHPRAEVIMLTGHASLELAMQGMESGAYDYLMKPMDLDELIYKIEDAYESCLLRVRQAEVFGDVGREKTSSHKETK